ncbi:MAG TPA: glycosyltransferase family 39 protein [Bryobacteraceae bacterium]|nr:glycosyltransferase family 39 protein [Bryobacteraceae bacterium]
MKRSPSRMSPTAESASLVERVNAAALLGGLRWVLLAAVIGRLWILPLPSSFWVDELVTFFVVKYPHHASYAAAPQVPASIYYWIPRMIQSVFGMSETWYRLPSVILMGIALFLIARLAARLIHPEAGWFAVFACLGLHGINDYADDARPYALGICVAAAALFFLVRWLDSVRLIDAALFAAFASLLWAVHLIYWPMYLVFALYPAVRIYQGETRAKPWQAAVLFGVVILAVIPQLLTAWGLLRGASTHVVAPLPGFREFQHVIRWNLLAISGGSAWLVGRFAGWPRNAMKCASAAWILVAAWWLAQPLWLLVFSRVTGNSVFVERYLSIGLPGIALAATLAASIFIPAGRWRIASCLFGIGVLVMMGQWTSPQIRHGQSDWRGAAQEERRLTTSPDMPVIVLSPFIEARSPVWSPDYPLPGFLYAHLEGYPIAGKPYLFPYGVYRQDGVPYAEYLLEHVLLHSRRFEIYGATKFWLRWFASQPEFTNWHHRMDKFGDVYLAVFDNPGQPAQ